MQLFALENQSPILACHAKKEKVYRCPECLNPLKVRGGPHRHTHFYHLKNHASCRQHQKSLTHLQVQWAVQSSLSEEATLEEPFPQIGRIADVAWKSGKIIFEIQCSPISLEEVENRCRDYESLGFTCVWILHDRRFNRRKMSAAETFLRKRLCFFTDIDARGSGMIYDQQESCRGALRVFRGPPIQVDLKAPKKIEPLLHTVQKRPQKFSLLRLYRIFFNSILENI
jgi:competence protein CoiA